jgi:alpha-tubulin suppressor-like RCC1 family protein
MGYYGELGDGTYAGTYVATGAAVTVSGITTATKVASGFLSSCAILSGGSVKCWGYWPYATAYSGNVPTTVAGVSSATDIVMGRYSACALISGGTVKCWGYNEFGQLGNNTTDLNDHATAVAVTGLTNAATIGGELDANHYCVTTTTNGVKCWGQNSYGQLGDGTTTDSAVPVAVPSLANANAVGVGYYHTCVKTTAGTNNVRCWGYNGSGQLGDGSTTDSLTPVAPSGLGALTATKIGVGDSNSCGIFSDGVTRCWGGNGNAQVGDGSFVDRNVPTAVSGLSGANEIVIGYGSTCARTGGTVVCWGLDAYAQGGDAPNRSYSPVEVMGLPSLSSGRNHSCRINVDDTVDCWGENLYGQRAEGGTGAEDCRARTGR